MTGTLVNTVTVLAGSLVGLAVGDKLPEKLKSSILNALGLVTLWVGVTMAIRGTRPLAIVASLILGGISGELLDLEGRLEQFGEWLRIRTRRPVATGGETKRGFVYGFVTASLLFCVGPMTIVGSIQDGTVGDSTLLLTKSVMDGFAAIALAATTGIGVLFSAVTVLLIQGSLTLLGRYLAVLTEPAALDQLSAVGGIIILGLGLRLLNIKNIPVANYLPALAIIAVIVVWF